ncbi:hypothetical protein PCORN_08117 [Listeria cornellensis FSL F6-0969]|uniref:Uncharacterized protein n=1 Tax=Listeria cornellensis FSL F6-0969 TaxID=1265820 RepID=W7C012_9LIST|nr:hypothetical protein PCORN_08117 [Listeria cornellensis FSL F6-0969]
MYLIPISSLIKPKKEYLLLTLGYIISENTNIFRQIELILRVFIKKHQESVPIRLKTTRLTFQHSFKKLFL